MDNERPVIAVVDDERSVRKALARLLRSAQFEVELFGSGQEFLSSLQTHRPACVVLDLEMAGFSGWEVLESLDVARISVPVVVISAHDEPEMRARCTATAVVAHLCKPVLSQHLFGAISRAIGVVVPAS